MTLVRRHLVVAVALVFAVATGIALGSGPLRHETLVPTTSAGPAAERGETGPSADDLAEVVAPSLYGGRLDARGVALLVTPGADTDAVAELTRGIEVAGGTVTARWRAGESLVGAHDMALVDTLGSQLLEQLDGRAADPDAPAYQRMGQLVGTAIATRTGVGAAPEPQTLTIRQGLDAATLLTTETDEARRAPLLLVVLGDDLDDHVVAGLVSGLASRASGTVVVDEERGDDLAALDELGAVTTVDGLEGAAGRLAAVLALARAEDSTGSYGASGSDGLLPLG